MKGSVMNLASIGFFAREHLSRIVSKLSKANIVVFRFPNRNLRAYGGCLG